MLYLLDTNTCVFFLRGQLDLDEKIRAKGLDHCSLSEVTIFELKFGAENSDNPKKSHKAVDKFVKGLSIIPIMGIIEQYAKTKVALRRSGTPMHDEFDLIIGVTALANNMTLVTDNTNDFRYITDLKLENWVGRN